MIFLITALKAEAAPLIAMYKLKKDMTQTVFPVYIGKDVILAISGTGKVRAAITASFLLTCYGGNQLHDVLLVNIGICGGLFNEDNGEIFCVHKLTDQDTKRKYYPEIYNGIQGCEMICVPSPVTKTGSQLSSLSSKQKLFFDMESAGIMESAGLFLETHQTMLLKIQSDPLSPEIVLKHLPGELVGSKLDIIHVIIQKAHEKLQSVKKIILPECDLQSLRSDLHFTTAMMQLIEKDMRYCIANGGNIQEILRPFSGKKTENKKEAKEIFEELRKKLRESSFPRDLYRRAGDE